MRLGERGVGGGGGGEDGILVGVFFYFLRVVGGRWMVGEDGCWGKSFERVRDSNLGSFGVKGFMKEVA